MQPTPMWSPTWNFVTFQATVRAAPVSVGNHCTEGGVGVWHGLRANFCNDSCKFVPGNTGVFHLGRGCPNQTSCRACYSVALHKTTPPD